MCLWEFVIRLWFYNAFNFPIFSCVDFHKFSYAQTQELLAVTEKKITAKLDPSSIRTILSLSLIVGLVMSPKEVATYPQNTTWD